MIQNLFDSLPRSEHAHLFETEHGWHALVPDGSRIFDIDGAVRDQLNIAREAGRLLPLLREFGMTGEQPLIDDTIPDTISVRALSLAVAQKCNLACGYCYAEQGSFGSAAKNMPLETALAAVDALIAGTGATERLNLAFLGGEPLVNRATVQAATRHALAATAARGQNIGFSITTNGTLLNDSDVAFFAEHGFAVTISMDGPARQHDQLRPFKSGKGSYQRIVDRIKPLLAQSGKMQVTARVTVTPLNTNLSETLDELLALGFDGVGFSPMLSSPTGNGEMDGVALEAMLSEMIACGRSYERHVLAGRSYPFANLATALGEIHRGTHRPYPCGAGGGYLGVSADGKLSACHRFVGDDAGAMGSLTEGIDQARKQAWMSQRHVHQQTPCNQCWARYLCGGGCHHETLSRGRNSCDYIRGWLHYCLQAYVRLIQAKPELFGTSLSPVHQ